MSVRLSRLFSPMLSGVRKPVVWLILQIAVATWLVGTDNGLAHRRVADTKSYLTAADSTSVREALGGYRTYGYPLFLELFRDDDGTIRLRRIPRVHLMVFFASVLVFWWGTKRFSGSGWLALAAASPLIYAPALTLVRWIQPDFLAVAFVVLAFAFLMLLLERRSALRWIGLALAVFITYQLRPAGLFLVALLPVLGGVWTMVRNREGFRRALAFAGLLAISTLGPYVTFAALRWITVGHFGLVSFGGSNAAGMAICFLDLPLVKELPEDQQGLARSILQARRRQGFEPMRRGDDPEAFFEQYSTNIFRISLSAIRTRIRSETRAAGIQDGVRDGLPTTWAVEANRALTDLARQILRRRAGLYLSWVKASVRYGMRQLGAWPWIVWPSLLLFVSIPLAVLEVAVSPRRRDPEAELRARSLICFTFGAVTFFCAYIGLIALISFPFQRYFVSAVILLPSMLVALLYETWTLVMTPTVSDTTR